MPGELWGLCPSGLLRPWPDWGQVPSTPLRERRNEFLLSANLNFVDSAAFAVLDELNLLWDDDQSRVVIDSGSTHCITPKVKCIG